MRRDICVSAVSGIREGYGLVEMLRAGGFSSDGRRCLSRRLGDEGKEGISRCGPLICFIATVVKGSCCDASHPRPVCGGCMGRAAVRRNDTGKSECAQKRGDVGLPSFEPDTSGTRF
jgi:hypothetical protein